MRDTLQEPEAALGCLLGLLATRGRCEGKTKRGYTVCSGGYAAMDSRCNGLA
jgi:hypothetical protein